VQERAADADEVPGQVIDGEVDDRLRGARRGAAAVEGRGAALLEGELDPVEEPVDAALGLVDDGEPVDREVSWLGRRQLEDGPEVAVEMHLSVGGAHDRDLRE